MKRAPASLMALVLCVGLISGCGWMKERQYTSSEAEKKLVVFCKKEGNADITTRLIGKTLWIYLGLPEALFQMKALPDTGKAQRRPAPFSLLSLDGEFDDQKNFSVTYDIVPDVLPAEASGYGNSYSENYTKKRQLLYQAIQETFFNVPTKDAPSFFVIVVADITKGIATKSTFYLQDLKEFMTGAIYEEYYMRELSEVVGNPNLIGDATGKALDHYEVAWPQFITDQIKNRIKFKFTQSDFKPEADPDRVIVTLAANTLRLYPFQDYSGVYLYNRREKREMLFTKKQLPSFEDAVPQEKGRRTIIHFDPKTGIN